MTFNLLTDAAARAGDAPLARAAVLALSARAAAPAAAAAPPAGLSAAEWGALLAAAAGVRPRRPSARQFNAVGRVAGGTEGRVWVMGAMEEEGVVPTAEVATTLVDQCGEALVLSLLLSLLHAI